MRKLSSSLILLLFTQCVFAQFTITGKVKNTFCNIYISEINKIIVSDTLGNFTINHIPKGNYTIEIRSIGFQTKLFDLSIPVKNSSFINSDISIIQNGETISFETNLEPIKIEMKEVVVSGIKNSFAEKSSLNIDVADINQMREKGELTMMETLASKQGISLISTGPGIARPVIRGLSGNRIVSVINGIKLENQQWDMEHTLGLNQYGIDRVEIIKGAATVLYGSDAMGGVLNFIDEKPAAVNTNEADISGGFNSNTFGTVSEFGVKSAKEHVNWSVRVGLNNHSDYYDANFDRVANSRFRELLGKATLGLNYKKSVTLFSYQMNLGYYGIVEPFEKNNPAETEDHPMEFETPYHTLLHQTILIKNTLLLGNTKLISTASYQYNQRMELEPGNTETNPFLGFNLNVATIDIKADHHFNDNVSLILGTCATITDQSNFGYSNLIPDYNQLDISAYALNSIKLINQKLSIDLGVRYDHRNINSNLSGIKDSADYMPSITKNYDNVSASAGFNYQIGKKHYLFANAGSGYRAPNMSELTSNGIRLETQRYEIGNTAFLKETNLMSEIGIKMMHDNIDMEGSYFYNYIQNYIYISRTNDSISAKTVYRFNQADATINGGEVKFDIHPTALNGFDFITSYSTLVGQQMNGNFLPLMPQNKIANEFILRGKVFERFDNTFLRLGYNYVFEQNYVAQNELKTPAYNIVNISAGGDVKILKQKIIFSIGVNNLLNEKYYDHLSRLRQYGVYNIGLNAFVNVKIPLVWTMK